MQAVRRFRGITGVGFPLTKVSKAASTSSGGPRHGGGPASDHFCGPNHWFAVSALLLWSATSALAFWPPLRDVQASKTTSGSTTTISYKVFDPVLDEWKEGSKSYSGYSISLTNTDGVVAWLASKSGDYSVGYAVYDPAKGKWMEGVSGYDSYTRSYPEAPELGTQSQSYTVSQLQNDDGAVCWLVRSIRTDTGISENSSRGWYVVYATYDPEVGIWQVHSSWHSDLS
jgi:hypothetical protein